LDDSSAGWSDDTFPHIKTERCGFWSNSKGDRTVKLVSYKLTTIIGESVRIGALAEEKIIDLNLAYAGYLSESDTTGRPYEVAAALIPPDMIKFFEGGEMANDAAKEAIGFVCQRLKQGATVTGPQGEKVVYNGHDVKLLAPVPRPASIRDTLSFEGHQLNCIRKSGGEKIPEMWYQIPIYYKGNPHTVIGPNEPILWPKYSERLDYELEFGVYIGKEGINISAERAHEYIAGYTIFNDASARDMQGQEIPLSLGPAKGKDFDGGNAMGPCLVTPDELDVNNLRMTARVNGETWSEGNTSDMYYSFPQIIVHISASETLYPGDFIGSGTPEGGCGFELDRWLQPGDVVELEVEGIGTLRNRVIKEGK
jgi:2-keto-4-pentenoate hydratase/2-oxohepta-3-ene-1,7-dioic acid hydratase in catechol pathway